MAMVFRVEMFGDISDDEASPSRVRKRMPFLAHSNGHSLNLRGIRGGGRQEDLEAPASFYPHR